MLPTSSRLLLPPASPASALGSGSKKRSRGPFEVFDTDRERSETWVTFRTGHTGYTFCRF